MSSFCFKKHILPLCAAALTLSFAACSDKDMPSGAEDQNQGNAVFDGTSVKLVTDQSILDQHVSNFWQGGARSSRAYSDYEWSMPDLSAFTPTYTLTVDQNIDFNAGGTYVIPEGATYDAEWGLGINSNNTQKIDLIIYGTLNVKQGSIYLNASKGANIYIAPTGTLNIAEEWGKNILNVSSKSLYIYAGAQYNCNLKVENGASIFVEGALEVEDKDLNINGRLFVEGPVHCSDLYTNNATIVAPAVKVDGKWDDSNNSSEVNVETYIDVASDVEFKAQSVINAQCLMSGGTMTLDNCVTLNINSYIKASTLVAKASGWTINMGPNALIDAGTLFEVQNKQWVMNFDNDESSYSVLKAETYKVMEGELSYISGYCDLQYTNAYDKNGAECTYSYKTTVKANGGTVLSGKEDSCRPSFEGVDSGNNDPLPPRIVEPISHIDGDHTHEISATAIALANGKAYLSWHKRGTSVHGCVEIMEVKDHQASLISWMESHEGAVQGGNNHDGNSAVSGSDAPQGELDFNNLIVVDETDAEGNPQKWLLTVGDHATKGGFFGAIQLAPDGNFAESYTDNFICRQLYSKVEGAVNRSGNAIVPAGDGYVIAGGYGWQYLNDPIADYGIKETYANSGSQYWKASMGNCTPTGYGSLKYVAVSQDGSKLASFYLNEVLPKPDDDDYWFNDNQTSLTGTLALGTVDSPTSAWTQEITKVVPVYGKNVIAFDKQDNIYVSAGTKGLVVFNSEGKQLKRFSIDSYDAAMGERYYGSAVNGVAVDDNYIYLAYGWAGLWILDKQTYEVVSYYTTGGGSANFVAVDEDYIYLAYGRNGVRVLQLQAE